MDGSEADVAPEEVFGLVDGDLLELMYNVGLERRWSDDDLAGVIRKFVKVKAGTTADVVRMIQCKVLNARLKEAGEKTMSAETLRQIVSQAGFQLHIGGGGAIVSMVSADRDAVGAYARGQREVSAAAVPTTVQPTYPSDLYRCPPAPVGTPPVVAVSVAGGSDGGRVDDGGPASAPLGGSLTSVGSGEEVQNSLPPDAHNGAGGAEGYAPSAASTDSTTAAATPETLTYAAFTKAYSLMLSSEAVVAESESVEDFRKDARIYGHESLVAVMEVPDWRVVYVPLEWLYFYQHTVAGTFSNGRPLQQTVDEIRCGDKAADSLPLINALVVDGMLYGMGTRRLVCYHHVWGMDDPARLIPVLYCHRACNGVTYNPRGSRMRVIGMLSLDNMLLSTVSRARRKGPRPNLTYLEREYNMNRQPVLRDGEHWVA